MKRRTLLTLGLGSFAFAAGQRYLPQALSAGPLSSALKSSLPPTPTASATTGPSLLRFVAVGDVGTGGNGQYAVAQAMMQRWQDEPYPLVLLTGDNLYENGEIQRVQAAFERPYDNLLAANVDFYAALGNHDVRTDQGKEQIAYEGYHMPSRYYSFTQGPVAFFALDTNQAVRVSQDSSHPATAAWEAQLQWLEQALQDASAPLKVVFGHHPVYSSGVHGNEPTLERSLPPLFARQGVHLYLNGHDHNYERSKPLEGTTYLTCGNGANLRQVGRSGWTACARSELGFTLLEVQTAASSSTTSSSGLSTSILIRAISTDNQVFDEAVITT